MRVPLLMANAKRPNGTMLSTAIRQDGAFRFPLTEGEYRISFDKLPPGLSIQSISYGSIDLLKDSLRLDGVTAVANIHITLEKKP